MSRPLPADASSSSQPTEYTPLFHNQTPEHDSEAATTSLRSNKNHNEEEHKSSRPLPKIQILLLCYARFMEPIAFFSIFPYIAEMVQRNGNLQASDVGFYSGLVESLFSATQAIFLNFWRIYADRWGRKQMLIYSLAGMAVGPVLFGMSSTLWQMIIFRSITGIFSSSNLLIRTMIGELSTDKTQAKAFSWYSVASNLAIVFGPVIGGALVDPARQYPSIFKGVSFFEKHPFALPGLVVGSLSATAAVITLLFLEDTANKEVTTDVSTEDSRNTVQIPSNISVWQLLRNSEIFAVFWSYLHVMICAFAFMAVIPVMLYTPIDLGGMAATPGQITICMSVLGGCEFLWILFVFPFLQRRIGTKGVIQTGSIAWPTFFAGWIVIIALLRMRSKQANIVALIVAAVNAAFGSAIWMSFTAAQLKINELSADAVVLGKLNYIAEVSSSIIRSVIPAITTTIFAVGVRNHILSGYLAMVILIVFALGLPIPLRKVKNT